VKKPCPAFTGQGRAREAISMHKVMISRANYRNCRDAVERAFHLFPLQVKSKKVLVKPNVLRVSEADQGIVTHPDVVKAVVEKLEELGPAEIVVGDNPGVMSYGANEEAFRKTGLMEASMGHYRNIGSEACELSFPAEFTDRVMVSRAVLDADVLISVPKFKTHGLTVITGGIKNSYGFLPGAQKANLHRIAGDAWRFNQLLLEVFCLRIPDLFIVDAVVGMEGNGPASPDLREIGLILASDNGVALDATIARLMGLEPRLLPLLQMAAKRGLGDYEESSIEILGELVPIPGFKVPPVLEGAKAVSDAVAEHMYSRIRMRPKADRTICTGCESCVAQCPVSALTMSGGVPVVDPHRCIACFCCQEICPVMAMRLC